MEEDIKHQSNRDEQYRVEENLRHQMKTQNISEESAYQSTYEETARERKWAELDLAGVD